MTEAEHLVPGPSFVDGPPGYEGEINFLNWNGFIIPVHDLSNIKKSFFDEIATRRSKNRSVIIVITGPAGEGKSYFAMRFAQIFDERFNILDIDEAPQPGKDPSQVVFEREHFLYLIGNDSPLRYGQVITADEAQYAMGSRRWYEAIQKDLMEAVESVRSRGFIIGIVALHLQLLDVIVRKFVLSYMFHVEERGRAVVYRLYTPRFETEMRKRRLGEMYLRLPDNEVCTGENCLRCRYSGVSGGKIVEVEKKCMSLRAIYERKKVDFVGRRSKQAQLKAEQKKLREKVVSDEDMIKTLYKNKDRLSWEKGRVTLGSMVLLIKDIHKVSVGSTKSYRIRQMLEFKYPEMDHRKK